MYVVYQHRRKDTNDVFYVGQGVLKRAYEDQRNRRNTNWINTVKKAGGFIVEILETGLTRDESLEREEFYIKKYGTLKHGTGILVNERLSGTRGHESGYRHSEEKRIEIAEKTKQTMIKNKSGEKISAALKNYFSNSEVRSKLKNNVKINQYDMHGNFIKTWNSMLDAERELKIWATNISSACRGLYKSTGGYKWSYAK